LIEILFTYKKVIWIDVLKIKLKGRFKKMIETIVKSSQSPYYEISKEDQLILSPFEGIVDQVFIQEKAYFYEWETILTIKTASGEIKDIGVPFSGSVVSVLVKPGDKISINTKLASLQDDLLVTGCD
jgi:biotin carboxyl carrier protein